jgi:hypothetical protein
VNAAYRTSSTSFTDTLTLPLYGESKTVTTSYPIAAAPGFDVNFDCEGRAGLGFGVGVAYYNKTSTDTVTASIPNPFFFNRFATANGQATGIGRTEVSIDVDAAWVTAVGRSTRIRVFAGPSVIQLRQNLVTDVSYSSSYPFDQVTFNSPSTSPQSKSKVGLNAGLDLAYMFSRRLGIGGIVRYTHATATLSAAGGQSVSTKLGGTNVGAGLRLRF